MKNKVIFATIIAVAVLIALLISAVDRCAGLEHKLDIYKSDVTILSNKNQLYKTSDSLNAIHLRELKLSIDEYEACRADDAKLIRQLKADLAENISKVKLSRVDTVFTQVVDTVIKGDSVKVFNYKDPWLIIDGVIRKDSTQIDIDCRDELVIVESKIRKKLCGLKLPGWLFGYKGKEIDIVSRNPHTSVIDAEWVNIIE